MKLFITGGDGLLGSNLIRELLKREHTIRVLIQPGRIAHTLGGLDLEFCEGDLLDYETIREYAGDVDAIFHLAANTSVWPARHRYIRKVNIEGTSNILRLAREYRIKRLIYVGTAASFSWGDHKNPGVEDTPYKCRGYRMDYMDSKWEAHQMVLEAAKQGIPAVIVNPTFMLGPYDSTPGSGAMIRAIYRGELPGSAPGGKNFINVRDAAVGIANALEKGRIGESYIIGNLNLTYREAFTLIADTLNVKRPRFSLPGFVIVFYGFLASMAAIVIRTRPKVSYRMAKVSCDMHFYSAQKAVEELELPQSPLREGILECFNWMKSNQII